MIHLFFPVEDQTKKRRKSLANTIISQQGTIPNELGQNLNEDYVDKISVLTESGEVEESEYDYSQPSVQSNMQRGSRTNPQGRVTGVLEEIFEAEADVLFSETPVRLTLMI